MPSSANMQAMVLPRISSLDGGDDPLQLVEMPVPQPAAGELLVCVLACGVCHTDLDIIEGRTRPPRLPVVLGHQVIGRVEQLGEGVAPQWMGQRVGIGWIHHSSGGPEENLSDQFCATGRDVQGGYAQYMTIPVGYASPIPELFGDAQAAPLLCAGAIGYRSLRLSGIVDGDPIGLTGFGASAHLVLQLLRHHCRRCDVYVFARDAVARRFAGELGAVWAGETAELAPRRLRAIIDTTPAWKPVVEALRNLQPGGRLVINAIRKVDADKDALLRLDYAQHLWMEKEIKSVANITARDIAEFLPLAASVPLKPEVQTYPLSEANRAIRELHEGAVRGAKVLIMPPVDREPRPAAGTAADAEGIVGGQQRVGWSEGIVR